ncbi:TrkA-N domain protein [Hyella patelloides LEGE 07179]|uniref:TrkA-N domain protein n=1 Tax=Hyella patelloides LEGE 07179 TaxID=945734 RepID=A0A563VYA7_9CYAN|nr:NAD-binding protein [Hyella patelloides]VEP16400.1 TrkA-N domain protein [Hyella patelloides LEGE 07179]
MKPLIIVCGLGRTGYKIYTLLKQQGVEVVGVSDRPLALSSRDPVIIGDARSPEVLVKAGIREAKTLVLSSHHDSLNLAILTQAKVLNPQIRIVNRLFNQTLGKRLDLTLAEHFSMSVASLVAPIFTFAALGSQAIGQLRLFDCTWPIHEEIINSDHPWLGKPLSQLWESSSRMLIYYLPSQGEIDLVSAVATGKTLEIGDHLIIGTKPNVRQKKNSWLYKLVKAVANLPHYQRYTRPIILVTLSLLILIFLATTVYVSVNFQTSVVDALYFSVGMITGAGGQEQVAEQAPDTVKVLTAIMMIVGAGVIGICYALINDFVLGSRLKQAWDVAKMPRNKHHIVCGLGGIGIQIVRQLHNQGHDVVAIEFDSHSRHIHCARSLGIPVVIEDASLATTLKAVNLSSASSLIAVTSSDTVNLEIALTAKGISPYISTIVRCYDPQFATSMQEVFEFDHVLSPIELAIDSFVAAALGGRILGNGMTQDLLWVALGTLITPAHPFCSESLQEAAMAVDFVPLYIERKGQLIRGWQLLETELIPQDVLYLTIPANGLEKLWRTRFDTFSV